MPGAEPSRERPGVSTLRVVADPLQSFDEFLGRTSESGGGSYVAGPTGASGDEGLARAAQSSFDEFLGRPEGAPAEGPIPMGGTLREWYTGANLGGTENGWNTQFMHEYQTGYNQAIEEGRSYSYFQRDDATGVVTWDNAGKDSRGNELTFGSVVQDGKLVGNVYEDFDRHTANLMMGDYMIQDGRVKARLSSGADAEAIEKDWDDEIATMRRNNTELAELAPRAEEFEEGVKERVESYGTAEEVGITALGAGGAAAMALPLLAGGPIGWAAYAGVVGLGALGTWLNQDSLKYQIARNMETQEVANREGFVTGTTSGLGTIAQNFFLTAMNPAVNLVQGITDAASEGGVGGGDIGGAFYATNDEGERTVSGAIQAAELVARFADSVLTFASPAGKAMYTAQMSAQWGSSVAGLLPGVGTWDDRRLEMDSIWTDQDGNFDAASSAAGIANVLIEGVQLGGMRGLLGQANREAARVVPGREKLFTGEGWWKPIGDRASRVGLTQPQREAVERGTAEIQSLAGYRFVIDKKTGELVGNQRGSLSMLAPSEALQSLAAKHLARRDAVSRVGGATRQGITGPNRVVRAEDIYQRANDLVVGEKRLHTILVNAFGEGTEEAAQGLLEPWSHTAAVDPEEVFRAAAAGFASGAGMGTVAVWQRPSEADRMYRLGALAHGRNADGTVLSRKDWDAMSALEQRRLVQQWSKMDESVMKGVWDKLERTFKGEVNGKVVGAAEFQDRVEKEFDRVAQRGAPATDDALTITQLDEARYRADARLTSHTQFYRGMENRIIGAWEQREILEDEMRELTDELSTQPDNEDLKERVADLNRKLVSLDEIVDFQRQLLPMWKRRVDKIEAAFAAGQDGTAFNEIADLNRLVQKLYDRGFDEWEGVALDEHAKLQLAKAVSTIPTRYPQDTMGSWSVFVPMVDDIYSQTGTNGTAAISEVQLAVKRADFDGDKIIELNQLMLDDQEYINARTGAAKVGPVSTATKEEGLDSKAETSAVGRASVEIATPDDEMTINRTLAQAFQTRSAEPAMANIASNTWQWLTKDVFDRYRGSIDLEVLQAIMGNVPGKSYPDSVYDVMQRGGDVRKALLDGFANRAGSELTIIARTELSDEYAWLARQVAFRLQEFQKAYAALTPLPGQPSATVVGPAHFSSEQHERRATMAATRAAQVANMLAGSSMFRFFGKLHHQKARSTEHTFDGYESDNPEFASQVRYYEARASGAAETKLETVHSHDPILANVLRMIQQEVTKSEKSRLTHDMALAANAMVEQFVYAEHPDTGQVMAKSTGKYVTLAQQLLYMSLRQYQIDNANVWSDPEVQAPYLKLYPLTQPPTQKLAGSTPANAERAFVEVFGAVQLYDLLGDASITMGPQRTVGQVYREFKNMDPRLRRDAKASLQIMGEYRGADDFEIESHTIPYPQSDIEGRKVTAYRTVVDSIFSAASNEISISPDGTITGKLAGDEKRMSDAFIKAHKRVRDLLRATSKKKKWTAQDIANLADQNPEFGRFLYKAIPDAAFGAVFRGTDKDGNARYADWFFELFTMEDSKQAEWSFLINNIVDQWRVLESGLDLDGDNQDMQGVNYRRLKSRWHRVMFRLAVNAQGNPMALQEFLAEATKDGQTREKFLQWANKQPDYVAGEAPLLGWIADTAQFDADKAGSGWTAGATSTPQILESFQNLHSAADRMVTGLAASKNAKRDIVERADAIERWHLYKQQQAGTYTGPTIKVDKNDEVIYDRFMAAAKLASRRHLVLGPRAMLVNLTNAISGVYPAHEKANNPDHMVAAEVLSVRDSHVAFQVLFDQAMGDLTSYDEKDVAGNAHLLMRGGGRLMTKHGREVSWEDQVVDRLLPLMKEPKHHHLFNTMMQPQVVELNESDDRASLQYLLSNDASTLLNGTEFRDLYPDTGGKLTAEQAFKYLSWLEGQVLDDQDSFVLQQKVASLAIDRTSALGRPASPAEVEALAVQAVIDYATFLQAASRTKPETKTENGVVTTNDPAHNAYRILREAQRMRMNAEILGVKPDRFLSLEQMRSQMDQDIRGKYDPRIMEGLKAAGLASVKNDPMRQASADEYVAQQRRLKQMELDRVEFLFDMDLHRNIRDRFWYTKDMPDSVKATQRQRLVDHVQHRSDLLTAAGEGFDTVGTILAYNAQEENWRDANPLKLTDEDLETLAREIITIELQHAVQVAVPENTPGIYPALDDPGQPPSGEAQYWDYDFGYHLDIISPDESKILNVARQAAQDIGVGIVSDVTEPELVDIAGRTILRADLLGRWTDALPIQHKEAHDMLTGASAKPVVSAAGHLSRTHGAEILATRRTFNPVDPARMSRVTLDWDDLNWNDLPRRPDGTAHPKTGRYHNVTVTHPTGDVQRPFHQLNNRFASELSFTYVDASGNRTAPQDLMDVLAVASPFSLAVTDQRIDDGGLREVHMERLRRYLVEQVQQGNLTQQQLATVEINMTFAHPDMQDTRSMWKDDIPASESHYNSLWHEGTVYEGEGDHSFGLISMWIFGNGGLNAVVQRAAIDTRKKGLLGLERYAKPNNQDKLDLEQFFSTDFADMLLVKTKILMETTLTSKKRVDPDFFNAVYKQMKLRHWVEGRDEKGRMTKWSAEQVIEWQLANPGKDIRDEASGFPLREVRLWTPSNSVLASMLGERGFGGVRGTLKDLVRSKGQTTNQTNFPQFQGWSPVMEEKFPSDRSRDPSSLLDTDVSKQSQMHTLVTRLSHDPVTRTKYQERQEAWRLRRKAAMIERAETVRKRGWKIEDQTLRVVTEAEKALNTMDIRINFPEMYSFLGMSQEDIVTRTQRDMANFLTEQRAETGDLTAGWFFQRIPLDREFSGLLTANELDRGKLDLAAGDLVVFDVASYRDLEDAEARREAQETLDKLVNMGVAIQLVSSKGANGLTHELAHYLRTRHNHQRYANNATILVPDTMVGRRYANQEASISKLVEIRQVKTYRQRLSVMLRGQRVTENAMWIPLDSRMSAIQTQFDLLPLDVAAEFHVPKTEDQLRKVGDSIAQLRSNPEALTALAHQSLLLDDTSRERAGKKPLKRDKHGNLQLDPQQRKDVEKFRKDFNRMADRIEDRIAEDTTLPLHGETFGTGDFIPLIGGGQMILYRHGHKFPEGYQETLLANSTNPALGGQYIVAYGEPEPSASTHTGKVVWTDPSNKFGMRLQLDIPVDQMGQKVTYEYNGMKYVQTHFPKNFVVPKIALFGKTPIDGFASLKDAQSKQAKYGLVTSFQKAFAVFGWDFRQDVADFFGITRDEAKSMLNAINELPNKVEVEDIWHIQNIEGGQSAMIDIFMRAAPVFDKYGIDQQQWTNQLYAQDSFQATVTRAILQYLMTAGANVDVALFGTGLNIGDINNPNALTTIPPELLTRVFDMAEPGGVVKEEFNRRINGAINKGGLIKSGPNAGRTEGWDLDVNSWRMTSITETGERYTGYLQFGEPHNTSDNPELNAQAAARKRRQTNSMHTTLGSSTMIGAQTLTSPKEEARVRKLAAGMPPVPSGQGKLWKVFTNVNRATMGPGTAWQEPFPLEWHHMNRSLDRFVQYRFAIPRDANKEVWDEYNERIEGIRGDIMALLGLRSDQAIVVDYWVRQLMYRPAPAPGQTDYADEFWPPHVLDAMTTILQNLKDGYFPTHGGNGPSFISQPDLRLLYQAAKNSDNKWAPWREEGNPQSKLAEGVGYGEWISLAFGQAFNKDVPIDPVLLLDVDGMMNTYRQVLKDRGRMLSISFDPVVQQLLLDPETNQLITVTASRDEKDRLTELVYLPAESISFEDLRRGITLARDPAARKRGDGWRLAERKRISRWRSKNKVRPMAPTTGRDYVVHGTAVLDEQVNMHAGQRIVLALRHATAMLNPGLYLSALPEAGFRGMLSQAANLISGQTTTKGLGKATAVVGYNSYSRDTIDRLHRLYQEMGVNGAFTSLIVADMMYQQPSERMGRTVSFFENLAKVGNLWQDPTWGTTQKAMARRYVEAVLKAVESTPISNSMTTEAVIGHLRANPAFFAESSNTGHQQIHQMAVNSVLSYRGLNQTMASLAARAIYEPWANSGNFGKRVVGTILKMSLMYTTYNANTLVSMSGAQGLSQIASMFVNNRLTAGTLINRMWKKMTFQEISTEDDVRYNMDSTLDGFTLANAFIKGGLTHTALFLVGMTSANGLGLTGEDEEARRRRRLAEAQNAVFLADPRRLEADFRNKDALFLDFLPPQLQAIFKVTPEDDAQEPRAMVQINWLLKPFLNPIIGMERFFQTGDFGEITHAFKDAVGSFPLLNLRTWEDALQTSEELAALAKEQEEIGTPEALNNSTWLLTNAVGTLESMLFENMFINSLYVGMDEYDRDPTKLILRNSNGEIQRTIEGLPRENDLALTQYVDPETGEVSQAYMERSPGWAKLAAFTENNATAAVVASLFTGFQFDLMRTQQAVRIRDIDLPQLETPEARAIVAAALNQMYERDGVNTRMFSLAEITADIKQEALKNGDWDTYNNLDAIAEKVWNDPKINPEFEPMSMAGEDGVERLTTPGAIAVVQGLLGGTVDFDSPALRNIAIPFEMREQIQAEMKDDTIQDGIDRGLTREQADKRWQRLFHGDFDNPDVPGIKDVLWSDRIPYSAKAQYKQLNTTYVQGPDGFPWATGVKRGGFPGVGGLTGTFLGFTKPTVGVSNAMGTDGRMNSTDMTRNINTGLRGLIPFYESELVETDKELADRIEAAIEKANESSGSYTPFTSGNGDGKGRGRFYKRYGGYRRGSYRRSGYGGAGDYAPMIYWSRQYTLPRGTNIYGNKVSNIFWDNPTLRRFTIRRERTQSSRGRLKEWQ